MNYPIKLTFKSEIVPAGLLAVTLPLSVFFYLNFPEKVASHWNFAGQVNGWMSRAPGAFAIPALILGMYLLFLSLPLLDPKKERYAEFGGAYHVFKGSIVTMMFALYVLTGAYNLGYPVAIGKVAPVLVGLLFVVLGNYMGKIKKNWFMGIRTPWTLSSDNVWNRTHRVGGCLFMLFGIVISLAPFLSERSAAVALFGGVFVLVFGTMGYSYHLYSQEQKGK